METTNKDIVRTLEELLKRTNSVIEAYYNASKNAHNRPLPVFFDQAAGVHEKFASELKQELSSMGGNIKDKTTMSSDTDRFWSDFAAIIVRRNESGILKNCARAERKAIEEYNELIDKYDLSDDLRTLLKTQREKSQQLLNEVTNLEKRYASD